MRWGVRWVAAMVLAEGRYRFFRDSMSTRVRWALIDHDGIGLPTHGAEDNLESAAVAAYFNRKLREEARHEQ